jgi:hypothetical protein
MPSYADKNIEELPALRDSILDEIDSVHFLRRVLHFQEAGLRQQLVEIEARLATPTHTRPIYNGQDQPSCLDCSEKAL